MMRNKQQRLDAMSYLIGINLDPESRFDPTWPLLPTGHELPLFHLRMICPVVGGGGAACLNRRLESPALDQPGHEQASYLLPAGPPPYDILRFRKEITRPGSTRPAVLSAEPLRTLEP